MADRASDYVEVDRLVSDMRRLRAIKEAAREVVKEPPLAGPYASLCAHCKGIYPSHHDNCSWARLRELLSTT